MSESRLVLHIVSDHPDAAERLDEAGRSLRSELVDVGDVLAVTPVATDPPEGTKSLTGITIGSLSVAVWGARPIAAQISKIIHDWQRRNDGKRVVIERADGTHVELRAYSEDATRELIESLLPAND